MRTCRWVRWTAVLLIASCWMAHGALAQDPSSLFDQAGRAFDRWNRPFDFDAYRSDLEEAIAQYEQLLPLLAPSQIQSQSFVLNRLAQAYFDLGTAFLTEAAAKEAAFAAGRDHALESLRLDPAFVEAERAGFRNALAGANDPVAVLWYGNTMGSYFDYHQLEAILGGGMRDIPVCYERSLELDETYLGAAAIRSLASFMARVPVFLGGDVERSRMLHEQAIAIDPFFFENKVNLAEFVLRPTGAHDEFCAVLSEVLDDALKADIAGRWPLYNELAIRRASALAEAEDCP